MIEDANDFYNWAKGNESAIKFCFTTSTDYKNAANFPTNAFQNIKTAARTMKLHPVFHMVQTRSGLRVHPALIAATSMIIPFNPNQITLAKVGA